MPAVAEPLKPASTRTVDVPDVEIFAVGEHRDGMVYTHADLDQMVENFEKFKDILHPTVVVGHEEDQSFLTDSGYPSAGGISRLWRDGDVLHAGLSSVPVLVAALIEARTYSTVSSEVYNDYESPDGALNGKALRRLSILGAELPQVKTIAELPEKYFGEGVAEFCSAPHRKALLKYQETKPGSVRGTFQAFCEVTPMLLAKRQKLTKFSDRCKAVYAKFAAEPTPAPDAPATPPPAGVTHDDMVTMLTEMGFDPAILAAITDDNVLAEIIRVGKTQAGQMMADAPPAKLAETPAPAPVPAPATAPAASSGIPGVPNATPSQVTLKFNEKGEAVNLTEFINATVAATVNASVAAAVKPINDGLAGAKDRVDKFEEQTSRKGVDAEFDVLLHEGKITPAEIEMAKPFAYQCNAVAKFSDGKTQLDRFMDIYRVRQRNSAVKFKDEIKRGNRGTGGGKAGDDTDPEVQEVAKFAEDHASAFRTAGLKADAYVATFKKKRAANPDYVAAQYIGAK